MKKKCLLFVLLILFGLPVDSHTAEFISVIVNTYPKRADGSRGKLSESLSVRDERWKIQTHDAIISKESESHTSVVWRVKKLSDNPIKAHITFVDQYQQPHSETYNIEEKSLSIHLMLPRIVNTLYTYHNDSLVEAEVWFGKRDKKNISSAETKCLGTKNSGYDFPTIWQGDATTYSLYIKPIGMPLMEVNLSAKIFGNWCMSKIDLSTANPEIVLIATTPIPGLLKMNNSAVYTSRSLNGK